MDIGQIHCNIIHATRTNVQPSLLSRTIQHGIFMFHSFSLQLSAVLYYPVSLPLFMTAILLHHSSGRMTPLFSVPSSSGVQHESMKHLALSVSAILLFSENAIKKTVHHTTKFFKIKKKGMIRHFHVSFVHLGTNVIPQKFWGINKVYYEQCVEGE